MKFDSLLPQLAQLNWHYIHKRFRTPLYTYLLWDPATKHYNQKLSFPYETNNFLYLNQEIAIAENDWQNMHDIVASQRAADEHCLLTWFQDAYKIYDQIEQWAIKLSDNKGGSAQAELVRQWNHYIELFNQLGAYALLPLFIERDLEDELRQAIDEKYGDSETERIYQILTTPVKAGTTVGERLSLLQLAAAQHRGEMTNQLSDDHLHQFSWITNNAFNGRFMTRAELAERLDEMANNDPDRQLIKYQQTLAQHQAEFFRYRQQFLDQPNILVLIDTLQESIFYRSWRTERHYRTASLLQTLFAETAAALGLTEITDLFYLIPPEIISCLTEQSQPDKSLISERKKGYGMLGCTKATYTFSGQHVVKAEQLLRIHNTAQKKTTELHGQTAYPGIVRGKARIVLTKADLSTVQPGDILVSPSTTVDFVPTLRRVAGLVTDEGGVLSHASVIARELHIPAIIGTKNGTTLFQNNEMIELDADHGIIRQLSCE